MAASPKGFTTTIVAPPAGGPSSKFTVDVVRIKKLPQSEDDPLPCSASVKLTVVEASDTVLHSETQKSTNNPYFNQTLEKELPLSTPEQFTVLIEIVEHARTSTPQVILYSSFVVNQATAAAAAGKTELSQILTTANPLENAAAAQQQLDKWHENPADAPTLVLRYRLVAPKLVKPPVDPNADVVLDYLPELNGSHRLVYKSSPFAWITLVSDTAWCDKFASCCIETWKVTPSLAQQIRRMSVASGAVDAPAPRKPAASSKGPNTPRSGSADGNKAGGGIKTMSDVITTAWCCKRSHQVLSRMRLSAEKFTNGDDSIAFSLEEELQHKKAWRERSVLRVQQCRKTYETPGGGGGGDRLRMMLDRLWWLFIAGVPAEGPTPALPFDVRHRLNQAAFSTADAEMLQACLLRRLVPWLTAQECEQFAKDDADPRTLPSAVRGAAFPPVSADPKASGSHQLAFVDTLSSFLGRIVDTLTDAEFGTALEYFIPAVREAHLRCFGSPQETAAASASKKERGGSAGKKKKKEKKSDAESDAAPRPSVDGTGGVAADGVSIKHLDKLGRRVEDPKFA